MSSKRKEPKAEEAMTAVIIGESFGPRFAPITETTGSWCLQPICNVPIIHYTLYWILRTGINKIIIVVAEQNKEKLESIERTWSPSFESFTIVARENLMTVGDAIRELDSRDDLLKGDFLLVTNPATFTSSTLKAQIEAFKKRRRENKDNVMTMVFSHLENRQRSIIGMDRNTGKLLCYHRREDKSKLDIEKGTFLTDAFLRRDITESGIYLCSLNVSAAFKDNPDFDHFDSIVYEVLANEETFQQQIHVSILEPTEAAISVNDYDAYLLASDMLNGGWFYPLVPSEMNWITPTKRNFNGDVTSFFAQLYQMTQNVNASPSNAFNSAIGENSKISPSAQVANVTLGKNTTVGSNSVLESCIIGDNCTIGARCRLVNVVIGNNVNVGDGIELAEKTVISDDMTIANTSKFIAGAAHCATKPHEDVADSFVVSEVESGFFSWTLKDGSDLWLQSTSRRRAAQQGDADGDSEDEPDAFADSDSGSDEEDGGELDPTSQFHAEVLDSMQRFNEIAATNDQMKNLILEVNSSKLAYNVSMEDVAKHVFLAFAELPGNSELARMKTLSKQWLNLFKNYYGPKKSQIQLLIAFEERFQSHPDFQAKHILHYFYNDLDVLGEEAIFEWFDTLEVAKLKDLVRPIVEWLQEDDDDEDSD